MNYEKLQHIYFYLLMGTNNKSYTKCYICFWFNNPKLHLQISLVYIYYYYMYYAPHLF